MKKQQTNWGKVAKAWAAFEAELGPLDFAFSEENAAHISGLIDSLLVATAAPAAPEPLHGLLDSLSNWLEAYEAQAVHIQHADPLELLQHLMDSNGLKQRDLAALLGGQSIVSAILNGRRRINARQAIALGQRFRMSPAAFLSSDTGVDESPGLAAASSDEVVFQGIDLGEVSTDACATVLPPVKRVARPAQPPAPARPKAKAAKAAATARPSSRKR